MLSSLSAPIDALLAPPPALERIAFLKQQPFAHRGAWGRGVPENSRDAINRAIAQRHGIVLDVRGAQGGEAFVFRDEQLERLTGDKGRIADRLAYELDHMHLVGSHETLPRLAEMLALIAGRVPLLIEVRPSEAIIGPLCLSVRRALEGYRGPFAVMSANPAIGRWFHEHSARTVRGLVVSERDQEIGKGRGLIGRLARHRALWTARPDFLAYDVNDLPSSFATAQKARGLGMVAWTIRTANDEKRALANAHEMIYERA